MQVKFCLLFCVSCSCSEVYAWSSERPGTRFLQQMKSRRLIDELSPTNFPDFTSPTEIPTVAATSVIQNTQFDLNTNSVSVLPLQSEPSILSNPDDYDIEIEFEEKKGKLPLNVLMGAPTEDNHSVEIHYKSPHHDDKQNGASLLNKHKKTHSHPTPYLALDDVNEPHRASSYVPIKEVPREPISSSVSSSAYSSSSAQTRQKFEKKVNPVSPLKNSTSGSANRHNDGQQHTSSDHEFTNVHREYRHHQSPKESHNRYDKDRQAYSSNNFNRSQNRQSNGPHSYSNANYQSASTYGYGIPQYSYAYPPRTNMLPYGQQLARSSGVLSFPQNRLSNILPQTSLLSNGFSIVQATPSRFHVGYPRSFAQAFKRPY